MRQSEGRGVPVWALPGELAAVDGRTSSGRTVRDWLVDTVLFLFAVALWLNESRSLTTGSADPAYVAAVPDWMLAMDPWVGGLACLSLWWRRRYPLAIAIAMVPVLAVSGAAMGAVLVMIFTVAIHRGWLPAVAVTAPQLVQGLGFALTYQPPGLSLGVYVGWVVGMFGLPLAWGLVVRFRRQVLLGLRREARQERQEQQLRLARARQSERERIAREMHDVLAHRISLLSVHAGALAYRSERAQAGAAQPLSGAEVAEAVRVIRENAHQALTELGEVLTVLRGTEPAATERAEPPPSLGDVAELVAEARAAGQPVTLQLDPSLVTGSLRPQEQRTIYRVVQEGLTNARKHAPAAPVAVRVGGSPGAEVAVAVSNPVPAGRTAEIPGTGAGLAGLSERVALDGGTLEHGAMGGIFQLSARLPWHGGRDEPADQGVAGR
ncbi:sensor histidine kinase [Natronosporangium hydrolyticum]|uniref:histidine kinase n=1 Tax=Natronosporangium hydrolyticum TaxID=2811111 RepID=A0A895Y8R6_9ACTN|nr:histidine kinase [Natronosporangium hydrolyticum]QSB12705.1 sensor histidine kinase [Natronosporangium hydrolyticum]